MTQSAKILVVDDTPQNVRLLADLLGAKGYTVLTAASGAEALEQVRKGQPDLVLMDVVMPGMTGYEACRRIRESPETALLPVVMVARFIVFLPFLHSCCNSRHRCEPVGTSHPVAGQSRMVAKRSAYSSG